jgi:hypothetical protein
MATGINVDYLKSTGNGTYTWTGQRKLSGIDITNDDGVNSLTFEVNGMTVTLMAGESYEADLSDFDTVEIVATGAWRIWLSQGRL